MRKLSIPMVCFCDIPLGNIEKHMKKYGNYAIGLNYKWARQNGLNPVWYVNHGSNIRKNLRDLYQRFSGDLMIDDESEKGNELMYVLCHIKKYSTKQRDDNGHETTIHYYDEREWRYVPRLFEKGERMFLTNEENNNKERHIHVQQILRENPLCFQPSDINYIIVRKDSEILETKHMLETVKSAYSDLDKEVLVTKILSAQRIKNDF